VFPDGYVVPSATLEGGYVGHNPLVGIVQQVDPDMFGHTPATRPMNAVQAAAWAAQPGMDASAFQAVPVQPVQLQVPQPAPEPARVVLSSAPAAPQVYAPREVVRFHLSELTVTAAYHEVILTPAILVLIFDLNYRQSLPPELRPTEAERPFKIEVGGHTVAAYYLGHTYRTRDNKEHSVLLVDPASFEQPHDDERQ